MAGDGLRDIKNVQREAQMKLTLYSVAILLGAVLVFRWPRTES